MANKMMRFFTVLSTPTSESDDGMYLVKYDKTSEIWMKAGSILKMMARYNEDDPNYYGIRKYKNSDSKYPTRIGSLQLHLDLPIQNGIYRYIAKFDGGIIKLDKNNSIYTEEGTLAPIDGSVGNLMLHIPDFYLKIVDTDDYTDWRISPYPLPGYDLVSVPDISPVFSTYDRVNDRAASVCSLVFDSDGNIMRDANGFPQTTANAAQFRGGNNNSSLDGTKASQLGMARTNTAGANIFTKCKNVGDKYHANSGLAYSVISLLYYIEYANFDVQETYNPAPTPEGYRQGGLGNGTAVLGSEWSNFNGLYPFIPSFVTAKLGNNTGIVSYTIRDWGTSDKTINVASYRGLECPYRHLIMLNSDYAVWHQSAEEGGKSLLYYCQDISKIVIPTSDQTTVPDGYEFIAEMPRTDGYITHVTPNVHMAPVRTGGSSIKAYCDSYTTPVDNPTPSYGWFSTRFCGYAVTDADAGLRLYFTDSRFSVAHTAYGFRLCKLKN